MGNGGHYGGIEYSIHTDPVVRALPAFVRGTYIQLFSLPENTALPGLILAGRLGLAESLGLDLDIFDDHIALLRQQGLVCVDWAARVCYVPAKARMVCNAAPSIWSARHWRKVINSAPSCALVEQAERDARALLMGRLRASRGDGRGKAIRLPPGCCSYCMNTKFQISIKRSPSPSALPGGPPGILSP